MYSKKNEKKKIVETEATLREKPQSISTKSWKKNERKKKWKEKKIKGKEKCNNQINILSILRHIIAISQPFMICSLFYFIYGCENTKKCSNLS